MFEDDFDLDSDHSCSYDGHDFTWGVIDSKKTTTVEGDTTIEKDVADKWMLYCRRCGKQIISTELSVICDSSNSLKENPED